MRFSVDRVGRRDRVAFYGLLLTALWLPDVDLALRIALGRSVIDHGTITHSIPALALFATLFAVIAKRLCAIRFGARGWWLIGATAYGSHLIMDTLTEGRGVMLLWPLWPQRIASPWPVFWGAHHSQPYAWHLHAVTLGTELVFVALVWLIAWAWARRPVLAADGPKEVREVSK